MTENLSRFTETKQAVSLKAYAEEHLEHRAGGLVCPVCKSGAKANGTPALSITPDGEHWQCFSCNSNGDASDKAQSGSDHKLNHISPFLDIGALGGARTHGLRLRRPPLCPSELRALVGCPGRGRTAVSRL